MIEMSHHEGKLFDFLGFTLDPSSIPTWLGCAALAGASYFAAQKSIVQLKTAWENANALPNDKDSSQ
jgi:hypothetical protein